MGIKVLISTITLITYYLVFLFPCVQSQSEPQPDNTKQFQFNQSILSNQRQHAMDSPTFRAEMLKTSTQNAYKYLLYQRNKPSKWNSMWSTFISSPRETFRRSYDIAGNPLVGVSSKSEFQLSAYFGPLFWAFLTLITTVAASIYVIKFFTGNYIFDGIVEKLKGPTGKAMDLDHLTNFVYKAFEKYGNWGTNKKASH